MTEPTQPPAAHLVDRGYRTYDGPRTGLTGAITSVLVHGMRGVLGLGRPARQKILPVASVVIAYVPAMVFVGLAALLPDDLLEATDVVEYSGYYGVIIAALVLFSALVAPEVLTGDRRTGMLALYLTTPLTRSTYVLARGAAVIATLLVVTVGPVLLMLIGFTFEGVGPDGLDGWLVALGRILLSGLVVALVLGGVSLGLSAFTDRRAMASAAVVAVFIVSGAVTGVIVDVTEGNEWIFLFNLLVVPFDLVTRIFSDPPAQPELSTVSVVVANIGWIVVPWAMTWWRYQRLRVDR